MFKIYIVSLYFLLAFADSQFRFLQSLRLLDAECNFHGHSYKNQCFCLSDWEGPQCQIKRTYGYIDDETTICDDKISRLDHLANISPNKGDYNGDDPEFSRLRKETVGKEGNATYGEKEYTWIKMHDITSTFQIFGGTFNPNDINQGGLGNCYLMAALASLQNIYDGEYIKKIFKTQTDNENHVYVTLWMIAGKPRLVAVDDWVPGKNKNTPFFADPTPDNDYWAMILEKSWAKINGNYMVTEGGSSAQIWKSLTQAPIFHLRHDKKPETPDSIFDVIYTNIRNNYPMGCSTPDNLNLTNEISGHAYSVLGAYNFTTSSGEYIKLIKVFNPWSKEVWDANPWGDNSVKWTPEIKKILNHTSKNDGIVYNTPEDYLYNFHSTSWAEVHLNYEVSYVDVPLNPKILNKEIIYNISFNVKNANKQPIYISVDEPDSRLFQNEEGVACQCPFVVSRSFKALGKNGKVVVSNSYGKEKFVTIEEDDDYILNIGVNNLRNYGKIFTVTAYAPINSFNFTQNFNSGEKEKLCVNNCSGNGKCNYFDGTCKCFIGFGGDDCSKTVKVECKDNCGGVLNGTCNENNGTCNCNPGFMLPYCNPCIDRKPDCYKLSKNKCESDFNSMFYHCKAYCGSNHYKNYEECYVPQTNCLNNCNGNGDCNKTNWKCTCKPGFIGEDCVPCKDKSPECIIKGKKICEKDYSKPNWSLANCAAFCGLNHYEDFGNCYIPRTECPSNCLDCDENTFICKICSPGFEGRECDPCIDIGSTCEKFPIKWCDDKEHKNYGFMTSNCRKYCGLNGSNNVGTCKK